MGISAHRRAPSGGQPGAPCHWAPDRPRAGRRHAPDRAARRHRPGAAAAGGARASRRRMSLEALLPLVLLLLLAVAAYVLVAHWTGSRRTALGIAAGTIVSADDSIIRAPTLRSERLGLAGRCDQL